MPMARGGDPVKVRVFGTPIPQGSTKAFAVRKGGLPTGRVVVTSDNPRTKPWRQAIIDATRAANAEPMLTGPVYVGLIFIMPRPASHYGTGRNAGQLKPGAPRWHTSKPDRDKLERAALDALTDAGVWRDDAQVVDGPVSKVYAQPGEEPGAIIEVTPHAI